MPWWKRKRASVDDERGEDPTPSPETLEEIEQSRRNVEKADSLYRSIMALVPERKRNANAVRDHYESNGYTELVRGLERGLHRDNHK